MKINRRNEGHRKREAIADDKQHCRQKDKDRGIRT